jgi:hypothetical protein
VSVRRRLSRERTRGAVALFDERQATLLDLVDNILNKGLMVSGDIVLSLADVDLVYLKLSALVCAADRVLPGTRRRVRHRPRAARRA